MRFRLDQISVRIVDVAENARQLFGDAAEEVVGRSIPEHDYRIQIVADNGTTKITQTVPQGYRVTVEDILAWMNG